MLSNLDQSKRNVVWLKGKEKLYKIEINTSGKPEIIISKSILKLSTYFFNKG